MRAKTTPMPLVTIKTRTPRASTPQAVIDAAQVKTSEILKRTESSDRVLVVYEKEAASIYYERKAKA